MFVFLFFPFCFVLFVVWLVGLWFVFLPPFVHVTVIFANKTVLELDEKVNKQNGDSNV